MKGISINFCGMDIDHDLASKIASAVARELHDRDPVMVGWHDRIRARMSPVIEGPNVHDRWYTHGKSRGGRLQIDVNGAYDFIFADAAGSEAG